MILDTRTKKTVAEGITGHLISESLEVHEILYCPGNGTRYHLVFAPITEALGHGEGWVVTDMNSLTSMLVRKGYDELLHFNYVMEKLKCGLADAVCLAEIIGHITGRPYVSCEDIAQMEE